MIYAIDWTIAAVALPHMQGTFAATQDQITWVMTSYIVVSAITLPTTGWLSARIGRKRLFLVSIAGFSLFSLLCGAVGSLTAEVAARVLQGGFGAYLIPLSQALMLDNYPPEQHAKATALWGLGVILGPVIGPTIGGWLTEEYSWRWVFYLSVPVGTLAWLGGVLFLPRDAPRAGTLNFDWIGYLTLSLGVGAFQLMLDRGERQDWFESTEIQLEAVLSALGFYAFIVHALTAPNPIVNLRLMLDRNYALGLIFVFLYGLLTLPPMVLLPGFLADLQGRSVLDVGMLLSPRGVGIMLAMLVLGRLGGRVDPRLSLFLGYSLIGISSLAMTGWNLEINEVTVIWTGLVQGIGAGAIVVPLGVVTFATLDPKHRTEAAAIWNLVRSAGSSIGISIAVFIVTHLAAVSRAGLVEHTAATNRTFAWPSAALWDLTSSPALTMLGREIDRQATMIGYLDLFLLSTWAAFLALPLVLLLSSARARPPNS
jgi:DHA2 family multidrug resistance protein